MLPAVHRSRRRAGGGTRGFAEQASRRSSGPLLRIVLGAAVAAGCLALRASGGADESDVADVSNGPVAKTASTSTPLPAAPSTVTSTRAARERLESTLRKLAGGSKFALGHEDTTAYGVGWSGDADRSDVKSLCGAHVAVYGWDVFGLEREAAENGDGVRFDQMRALIQNAYRSGGINTISWHADNPVSGGNAWDRTRAVHAILPGRPLHARYVEYLDRVADFLESLRGDGGELIPVIFRPFHEHTGSWFWWGAKHTSDEDYVALWRFTVEHLRHARGLGQLLFAFSPGGGEVRSVANYLYRYPGDDYVDVFGVDHYYGNDASGLIRVAEIVVRAAELRGKVPALTEVGARGGLNASGIRADWVVRSLVQPLERSALASRVAYVMAWRNARPDHCFLPYPGHPGARSFQRLCGHEQVLLADDLAKLE